MKNFGFDQTGSPAPLWWRRFERAYIIVFAPALASLASTLIETDRKEVVFLSVLTFSSAIVKGIGIFYGTGEAYPDAPTKENEDQ